MSEFLDLKGDWEGVSGQQIQQSPFANAIQHFGDAAEVLRDTVARTSALQSACVSAGPAVAQTVVLRGEDSSFAWIGAGAPPESVAPCAFDGHYDRRSGVSTEDPHSRSGSAFSDDIPRTFTESAEVAFCSNTEELLLLALQFQAIWQGPRTGLSLAGKDTPWQEQC